MTNLPSKRLILQAAGYLFFAIGFIGMLLPLLPTTVFWVIAAACFAKSAPSMHKRILSWPSIGPAIGDYLEHGIITRRSKTIAVGGMAIAAVLIIASPLPPLHRRTPSAQPDLRIDLCLDPPQRSSDHKAA